ncbi:MAG TPA: hypothetical protein VD963_05465 [Phycisphaerales bacterium]|nr:hypothetical protein [Phycisphaerales bacterium]
METDNTRRTNMNAGDRGNRTSHQRQFPSNASAGDSSSRSRSTKSGADTAGSSSSDMGGAGSTSGTASPNPPAQNPIKDK